jgi:hypothetical protein
MRCIAGNGAGGRLEGNANFGKRRFASEKSFSEAQIPLAFFATSADLRDDRETPVPRDGTKRAIYSQDGLAVNEKPRGFPGSSKIT